MIEPTAATPPRDLDLLTGWLSQTAESERLGARFTALADAVPAGVVVMTRDQVLVATERARRVAGDFVDELPRVPLGDLFPERDVRATVRDALRRAWAGTPVDLGPVPFTRPDGTRQTATVAFRPLPREATPTLLVVLGEPAGARTDREPGSTLRQFGLHLAALANTLRAPLTAHLAQLGELTRRPDVPAHLRESFELYRTVTGETLDRLARAMEWGRRGPLNEPVDVAAVIDAAVAALESETFLTGGIRLERDLARVPPVLGLASQLQLAVEHVLRNACEALAARGGTIRVALAHDAGRVTLTVRDDGPGIPDSLFPHVFEPFSSTKSIATGLGLGLAIVKDIVSRHGGDVSLETGAGGTLVTLAFAALDAAPPATATPRARRVLIVDDNAELQETFRLLIQRAGYDVIGAADAEEALTLVSTHDVDALIIDVQLSGRDGLALLEALAMWHPHLLPRVALQTAFAYEERVRAVAERYQVVLLAKPSPVTVLLQTLAELTKTSAGGGA